MYYQVVLQTNEKTEKSGKNRTHFQFDQTDIEYIKNRVVSPYSRKEEIQFNGYFIKHENVKRISIKTTQLKINEIVRLKNQKIPDNVFFIYTRKNVLEDTDYFVDVTHSVFDEVKEAINMNMEIESQSHKEKIFIVHGRDDNAKIETARFVERLGFKAVILHEQANSGETIIEKIESNTNVGFAIVLYTPCDSGSLTEDTSNLRHRARQNVVFEHGYLIAKLGRKKVCALVKGEIEKPTDISGIVYIDLDSGGAWQLKVAKELQVANYPVDMNKLL
jgi:predicted nucleotide-binding protein